MFAERAARLSRTPQVLMVLADAQLAAGQRAAAIATIEQAIAAALEGA